LSRVTASRSTLPPTGAGIRSIQCSIVCNPSSAQLAPSARPGSVSKVVPRTAVRRHPKAPTHLCTRSVSCLSPPLDRPVRRPELGPRRSWLLHDILGRAPWRSGFPGPLRFRSQALSASQRFASRSEFHGLVACRSRSACPPTSTPHPHSTRAAEAASTDAEPRSRAGDRSLAVGLGSPSKPSPRLRHLRAGRPTWRSGASSGRPFRECCSPAAACDPSEETSRDWVQRESTSLRGAPPRLSFTAFLLRLGTSRPRDLVDSGLWIHRNAGHPSPTAHRTFEPTHPLPERRVV
jgi:hypothetical protein